VINNEFEGSIAGFFHGLVRKEGIRGLVARWPSLFSSKSFEAWNWFIAFGVLQGAMQLLVPGKVFRGPVSPMGNVPEYKANGVQCFALTGVLFYAAIMCEPASLCTSFALCYCLKVQMCIATALMPGSSAHKHASLSCAAVSIAAQAGAANTAALHM
jgi:hypothetical protein